MAADHGEDDASRAQTQAISHVSSSVRAGRVLTCPQSSQTPAGRSVDVERVSDHQRSATRVQGPPRTRWDQVYLQSCQVEKLKGKIKKAKSRRSRCGDYFSRKTRCFSRMSGWYLSFRNCSDRNCSRLKSRFLVSFLSARSDVTRQPISVCLARQNHKTNSSE